jgi:hypothetical protein
MLTPAVLAMGLLVGELTGYEEEARGRPRHAVKVKAELWWKQMPTVLVLTPVPAPPHADLGYEGVVPAPVIAGGEEGLDVSRTRAGVEGSTYPYSQVDQGEWEARHRGHCDRRCDLRVGGSDATGRCQRVKGDHSGWPARYAAPGTATRGSAGRTGRCGALPGMGRWRTASGKGSWSTASERGWPSTALGMDTRDPAGRTATCGGTSGTRWWSTAPQKGTCGAVGRADWRGGAGRRGACGAVGTTRGAHPAGGGSMRRAARGTCADGLSVWSAGAEWCA